MPVGSPHIRPGNAAVGVGAHLSIHILHQVSGVLSAATAQAVDINQLRAHFIGKICGLAQAKIGGDSGLTAAVIQAMNLIFPALLVPQGSSPIEQVGDGAAGVADGTEPRLPIQRSEVLVHLHGLRIKGTITIVGVAVIDAKDAVSINVPLDVVQVHRQFQRHGSPIVGNGLLQGGTGSLHLGQVSGQIRPIQRLFQGHGHGIVLAQAAAVIQRLSLRHQLLDLLTAQLGPLVGIYRPGLLIGKHPVVDIELVHIAPHGVGILVPRRLVGTQTQGQHLINGVVRQGLLAVQLPVDVELYLAAVLVNGNGNVLPAPLDHGALGDHIGAVDVGMVLAIPPQRQHRPPIPLMLEHHRGCGAVVPGNGGVIAVPHGEGGGSRSRIDVVLQLHEVVHPCAEPQHLPKYRVAAVRQLDAVPL